MTLCQICKKPIRKRDEVFRVLVERARFAKGDSSDPIEWSAIANWDGLFVAHAGCAKLDAEIREDYLRVPLEDVQYLLDEVDANSESRPDHLSIVE